MGGSLAERMESRPALGGVVVCERRRVADRPGKGGAAALARSRAVMAAGMGADPHTGGSVEVRAAADAVSRLPAFDAYWLAKRHEVGVQPAIEVLDRRPDQAGPLQTSAVLLMLMIERLSASGA